MKKRWFVWCGVAAPIWLLIGVTVTSLFYPGFSHLNQAMSELGAKGAPTHLLTPLLNHVPLSVLFVLFGISVTDTSRQSIAGRWSGWLIVGHGIFTLLAGIFSCDFGCYPPEPSTQQLIHNFSGGMLFLTITAANLIWVFIATSMIRVQWFRLFSVFCLLGSLIAIGFMGTAMQSGELVGLYQRLNYGFSALWMLGLATAMLLQHSAITGRSGVLPS